MFFYGKTAANAISIMSYLASEPGCRAGSAEIAEARHLSTPLAAKLLTQLATAGLVKGQPGPGGGYKLAKPAREIRLADIVSRFEQADAPVPCPFGPDWCGVGDPCPLHDAILKMMERNQRFLEKTRLSVFAHKPSQAGGGGKRR